MILIHDKNGHVQSLRVRLVNIVDQDIAGPIGELLTKLVEKAGLTEADLRDCDIIDNDETIAPPPRYEVEVDGAGETVPWSPITWVQDRGPFRATVYEVQGAGNYSWCAWRRVDGHNTPTPIKNGDHIPSLEKAKRQAEKALEQLIEKVPQK